MAQDQILFKEYVFPRGHKNAGEKVFRQTTPKGIRMLENARANFAKAKVRKSNIMKEYSEPHEWNVSAGPQSYKDVVNTVFTSGAVAKIYYAKYPADGSVATEQPKEVESKEQEVIFPEIQSFDLAALIAFGLKNFPEKADEINKSKYPNPLRENIRSWGKAAVKA